MRCVHIIELYKQGLLKIYDILEVKIDKHIYTPLLSNINGVVTIKVHAAVAVGTSPHARISPSNTIRKRSALNTPESLLT